jgi:hypothetical protein
MSGGVRRIIAAACSIFAVTVGCAYPSASDQSIYDYPTGKYTGNGGSTSAPDTPSQSEMDAAVCKVQGSASITGVTLAARDAIELFDATKARFTFLITDYTDACSYNGGAHAGSHVISVSYDASALRSGTYDVTSTPSLVVKEITYDSTCKPSVSVTATSGSVVFDKLDDCGGTGSLDLTFGSAQVSASFTASVCAVPSGVAASCK